MFLLSPEFRLPPETSENLIKTLLISPKPISHKIPDNIMKGFQVDTQSSTEATVVVRALF